MSNKFSYQKHIDGLRAFAVLSVILYHLSPRFLSGGFLGVDIFFVISGYLITGIILKKAHTGDFVFTEFYKRRIKRILPLYFLVLSVTTLVAWQLLLPTDLIEYSKSVLSTLAFVSNFFFFLRGGYFAPEAAALPLLHTWSLSVEEQYYLCWPVLILLLARLGGRLRMFLMSFGILLGAGIAEFTVRQNPDLAFYSIHTRFFELMAGAILAQLRFDGWEPATKLRPKLAWFGIALLLGSVVFFSDDSRLPGILTFIPVFGTCFLILSGGKQSRVGRALASRPMVYVGLISYSLYLWHWPVFSFMRYLRVEESAAVILGAGILIWGLSHVSSRLVENPVRRSSLGFSKSLVQLYVVPLLIFAPLAIHILRAGGLPDRLPKSVAVFEQDMNRARSEHWDTCTRRNRNFHLDSSCIINGNARPQPDVVLWGDSHANHLVPFIEQVAITTGHSVRYFIAPGCPPLSGALRLFKSYRNWCVRQNEKVITHIQEMDYLTVVIAANWYKYQHGDGLVGIPGSMDKTSVNSQRVIAETLEKDISELMRAGREILLMEPVPVYETNPSECEIKNAFHSARFTADCRISRDEYHRQLSFIRHLFGQLQSRWKNLRVISVEEFFCKGLWCNGTIEGAPLYHDSNHLTETGSRMLGEWYVRNQLPVLFSGQADVSLDVD